MLEGGAASPGRTPTPPTLVAHSIAGRVLDDRGVPVALAQVTLRVKRTAQVRREQVQQATDDLGQFLFGGVDAGTYKLQLSGGGRETLTREINVLDADVSGVEFVVTSGRFMEVLVEADELPSSGLGVSVLGADGVDRTGVPDARGRVTFTVPEGRTRASINHFPEGWLRGPGPRSREARVAAEPVTVRLPLVRADMIVGFVRRRDGRPVPGAAICFRPENAVAGSDETGAFRLAVQIGAVGDLVCEDVMERPGQPPSGLAFYGSARGVRAGATGVVVVVDEIASDRTLTALVRTPDGAPAVGVGVRVGISSAEGPRSEYTDETSHATFTKLPARPVYVGVEDWRILKSAWLPPDPPWIVSDGPEVMFDLLRGLRLTGRITGRSGPLLNASIEAWHEGALVAQTLSDNEGRFGLTVDPAKHLPLMICAHLGKRYHEETLLVERLPTATLEFEVRDR